MARRNSTLGRSVLDLDVDDSKFHSKLSGAARAAANFTDQAGAGMMKAGKAISGVGESMTRNVTLPILAAGGAVAKFALDFDTTMRRTVGLTDVTADQIGGIREELMKLGPEVGKSPQELAEAFYFVASAGFKAEEALEVLRISAKASATGLGETQTIAQVLGGVINAYGKENITASRAADILTEAVSQGTAEASGFAAVIGNVVPGAAALGVSFDQVTAAMAGMTLSGVGVEESATSLIQIFASLLKPTTQAEDALKGLGLSSAELRRQLREEGLLATLRTLEERFAGNETAAAAVFGNIRALRGVTALLGLDTEQLNTVFAKVEDSLGRLDTAYEDTEGPQRELDRSMARLQATAIELGADVLPMVVDILNKVADAASGVAEWWRGLDKGTRELIVSSLAWLAVAGPALMILGKLTTGAGALLKVIGFLAGAQGIPAVAGALKGLGVKGLGVIAIMAALGFWLNSVADDVSYFFDELLKGTKATKTLKGLMALTDNMHMAQMLRHWGISVEQFSKAVERADGDIEDAFNSIKDNAGDVSKALEQLGADDPLASGFGGWGARGPGVVEAALEAAKVRIAEKAGEIPQVVSAAFEDGSFVVEQGAEEMVDPIQEALKAAVVDAGKRAQDIIDALANTLADGPDQIKDELQALRDALINPYTEVERRAGLETALANKAIIANLRSGDPKIAAEAYQQVQNWLAQYELLEPGALAAGNLVNPALQAGIDANLAAALQWVQDTVTGPYANLFDLADVLREQGEVGLANYVDGVATERGMSLVPELTAIQRAIHAMLDVNLRSDGAAVISSYADGMSDEEDYLLQKARNIKAGLRRILEFAGSPAYTHSREIGAGVGDSYMDSMLASVTSALPTLTATLVDGLASMPHITAPLMPALSGALAGDASLGASAVSYGGAGASGNTFGDINITAPTVPMTERDIGRELRRTGVFGGLQ